jgi:hypothetical protein
MSKSNLDKWVIVNGEWFEKDFSDFIMSEEGQTIREYLTDKKYKVSDTGETYRVINSWSESGLLLDELGRENGWRKFSLSDLLWLQILKELRGLGLGLDKLKELKGSIFKTYNGLLFDFFIAQTISKRDILLIIHPSGFGALVRESEYHFFQNINPSPATHIIISLNKLYSDLINKPELKYKNEISPLVLDTREVEILSKINEEDNLKEIKVNIKNKKIDRIHYKTHKDSSKNIKQIVKEFEKAGGNGDLILKKQDGRYVAVEQTDKT